MDGFCILWKGLLYSKNSKCGDDGTLPTPVREWLPGHAPDLIQQANAGRDRKYREKLLQFLFFIAQKY